MPKITKSGKPNLPYLVSWYHGGKRERFYRKTRKAAEQKQKELMRTIVHSGAEGMHLDVAARDEYFTAKRILQPYGLSVIEAALQCADRLKDRSQKVLWADAVFQLVESLERANRRQRTIDGLKTRLRLFQEHSAAHTLDDLNRENIEAFLGSGDWKPSTVASYRTALSRLGNFALRRGWLRENPIARIDTVKLDHGNPVCFTIEEANRILTYTSRMETYNRTGKTMDRGRAVRHLCLLLLAGLRPDEARQITPENILKDGLRVNVGKKRGRRSLRIVLLGPEFWAWWENFPGPVPCPNFRRIYARALKDSGIDKTGTDLARHTWISAKLAVSSDENAVARMAGNSPDVIYNNYFQLIDATEAAQLGTYCPLDSPAG